jgi:hypothetical protein
MRNLVDYLFHYNEHTKLWNAFLREDVITYFNDFANCKSLISNKSIDTIIDFISTQNKNG